MENKEQIKWIRRVVVLSLVLLFFTLPHTLEDFATGAPEEAGVSPYILTTVISIIFFLQGIGLYWMGQKNKKGLYVHVFLGLFWPVASGIAQLPIIFASENYRAGMISKVYVFGMIIVGVLMLFATLKALSISKSKS